MSHYEFKLEAGFCPNLGQSFSQIDPQGNRCHSFRDGAAICGTAHNGSAAAAQSGPRRHEIYPGTPVIYLGDNNTACVSSLGVVALQRI